MTYFLILASLSLIASLVYGLHYVHLPASTTRTLIKAVPIGALALLSLLMSAPWALTLALAFGALGDVFLSKDGERPFLLGLGAFLIGHLFYVALLASESIKPIFFIESQWRLAGWVLLAVIGAVMVNRLWSYLGALRLPVMAYLAVTLAMGFTALSIPFAMPYALAMIGALLFIASDAILGLELFVHKGDKTRTVPATLLWFLYWSGQALIALAFINH